VITGLRSLSIGRDNRSSQLQEQPNHEKSEKEPTANQELTTATAAGTQNGIVLEAAKVVKVIMTAAAGYPWIKTFRGKEGEDVDRFLKNVPRYIKLKVSNGMYKSDMEQHMDHVTLIYSHYACRVQEYIDTMDGKWEVNPTVVQDGLNCCYRRIGDTGVKDNVNLWTASYRNRTRPSGVTSRGCKS